MGREAVPGAARGEVVRPAAGEPPPSASRGQASGRPRRASLGGRPAQERELRAQGRQTLRNLLEAGLAELDERGVQGVKGEDILSPAQVSPREFQLDFSNQEDPFKTLLP